MTAKRRSGATTTAGGMSRASSFATFLIIGPTCFFLGILFASFPYEYNVLWAMPLDREPYFQLLENHLKFIHAAPPLVSRILHIVIGTGVLGFVMKLYEASEANLLFDGASLVLYMCGVIVYITNIVKGLRVVTAGVYGQADAAKMEASSAVLTEKRSGSNGEAIGREDSLRVLAASNTILALVLVGVLVLQAGQWYAQQKEDAEIAEMDRIEEEKKRSNGGKKKQ